METIYRVCSYLGDEQIVSEEFVEIRPALEAYRRQVDIELRDHLEDKLRSEIGSFPHWCDSSVEQDRIDDMVNECIDDEYTALIERGDVWVEEIKRVPVEQVKQAYRYRPLKLEPLA